MTEFIAIDPGGTTGWALFREGKPFRMGETKFDEVWDWIDSLHQSLYVVEDYIVRPASVQGGYSHQWNKGEALQIIGGLKFHASRTGAEIVLQQPSIKHMAAKFTNLPYKKGKSGTHMQDAVLHGAYFWRKENGPDATDEASTSSGHSDGEGIRRKSRVEPIQSWQGLRKKGRS